MEEKLLSVQDLSVKFPTKTGPVCAVNHVSFDLYQGEILGIVGESGSGKSVTIKSVMRLLPPPPAAVITGDIVFAGKDILQMSQNELYKMRGKDISMIFQNPMSAFDPVIPIGKQVAEPIEFHEHIPEKERIQRVVELFKEVGISNPEYRVKQYPHEFSGGMLQRAMIASGLICSPQIVLADEPTTGLDVTIQAQIVRLVKKLRKARKTSWVWITHDLSLLASFADRILVMYGGSIVEEALVEELYGSPMHPYTQGMLEAVPSHLKEAPEILYSIPGLPPDPKHLPAGCAFCERCSKCQPICRTKMPRMKNVGNRHYVACWQYQQTGDEMDE